MQAVNTPEAVLKTGTGCTIEKTIPRSDQRALWAGAVTAAEVMHHLEARPVWMQAVDGPAIQGTVKIGRAIEKTIPRGNQRSLWSTTIYLDTALPSFKSVNCLVSGSVESDPKDGPITKGGTVLGRAVQVAIARSK